MGTWQSDRDNMWRGEELATMLNKAMVEGTIAENVLSNTQPEIGAASCIDTKFPSVLLSLNQEKVMQVLLIGTHLLAQYD